MSLRHRLASLTLLFLLSLVGIGCAGDGDDPPETAAAPGLAKQARVWHIAVNGEQRGPFTESELRAQFIEGEVRGSDLAWREGLDWMPFDDALRSAFTSGDRTGAAFLDLCQRAASVPDADLNVCAEYGYGEASSPAAAQRALERHAALIADAREGMSTIGDMGIDYADGAMMLLSHLAPARRLAKLLHADAILQQREGNDARAAADVAAIARIGAQTATDRTGISCLVTASFAELVIKASGGLEESDVTRRVLQPVAAWLAADDPFGIVGAMAAERDFLLDDLAGAIRDGRLREYAQIEELDRTTEEELGRLGGDLDAQVTRCKTAYSELIQLLSTNRIDRIQELPSFLAAIERGEHGVIARVMMGRAGRLFEALQRVLASAEAASFIERFSGG